MARSKQLSVSDSQTGSLPTTRTIPVVAPLTLFPPETPPEVSVSAIAQRLESLHHIQLETIKKTQGILADCIDDEIVIWAAPALQDLTIEDVIGWYGEDIYAGLAAQLKSNILDGGKLRKQYINMAISFVKTSFPLQGDPEALAVVLSRLSLIQIFQERATQ